MTFPYTLQSVALTAVVASYVVAPANSYLTTKKVTITNTSGSAVAVTVYKVPAAGAPGAGNVLVGALVIPANTTNGGVKEIYELENQLLSPGDSLQAFAGTAAVLLLNVSGIVQTV